MNVVEIESAISDLALEPFDAAEFPFTFLAAFGRKDAEIKRLRAGNNNASDVPRGVLLRSNIHITTCEPGSVGDTLKALRASPATATIFISCSAEGLCRISRAIFDNGCKAVSPPTVPRAKGISIHILKIPFSTEAWVRLP